MKVERDFLVQTLKDAGVKGKIHESMKSLKNCNEIHVGAVLRIGVLSFRLKEKIHRPRGATETEEPPV